MTYGGAAFIAALSDLRLNRPGVPFCVVRHDRAQKAVTGSEPLRRARRV